MHRLFVAVLLVCLAGVAGCRRGKLQPRAAKTPTIASLVPAATDLIVAMGARDHLVAVSNYDRGADAAGLPRVGDYQTIDWEKLAQIRPNVMITEYGAGHAPPGFVQRAQELGIRRVNVRFDRLDDIYAMLKRLGEACDEPGPAAEEANRIARRLRAVHRRVALQKPVRTIVVTGDSGNDLAGRGTYLDDLLSEAGGSNAVKAGGYVTLDREAIAALAPDAVLILAPGQSAQAAARARADWNAYTAMPAVRDHRVWTLTESYILQPGSRVADVAELFARALHPRAMAASQPSTRKAQ